MHTASKIGTTFIW